MQYIRYSSGFQRARFWAELEQARARLMGQSIDLLDFEAVRRPLHTELPVRRAAAGGPE
jgi:hypothetical protein